MPNLNRRHLPTAFALLAAWTFSTPWQTLAFDAVVNPRLAAADLDGDGRDEVVAAGRVGPFRPLTDPVASRAARVEAYAVSGRLLTPVAACDALSVADDVAGADLDGDGRDEVLVTGAGRLTVLSLAGGRLVPRQTLRLPWDWTHRLACGDLDADGTPEVVVAAYDVAADGDVGRTTLVVAAWRGSGLEVVDEVRIRGHVGDLSFVTAGRQALPLLVVACGAGDEGGEGIAFRGVASGLVEVWRTPLQVTSARIRSLSAVPGSDLLAAVAVDGSASYLRCDTGGITRVRTDRLTPASSALLLAHGPEVLLVLSGPPPARPAVTRASVAP